VSIAKPTFYKFNIDTCGAIGAKVGYEVKQVILANQWWFKKSMSYIDIA